MGWERSSSVNMISVHKWSRETSGCSDQGLIERKNALMNSDFGRANTVADVRPLNAGELLSALHLKFADNFNGSRSMHTQAIEVERQARSLAGTSSQLQRLSSNSPHQFALIKCLDEIFGDSMCALYLACCGMTVPARMLLRRSLELGLVVVAYWDSPVDYWNWQEHDEDIRFSTLFAHLQSPAYKTMCQQQFPVSSVDSSDSLNSLEKLYKDLSNVVHPKPYNFSTAGATAYSFQSADMTKTLAYASQILSVISITLAARFASLSSICDPESEKK